MVCRDEPFNTEKNAACQWDSLIYATLSDRLLAAFQASKRMAVVIAFVLAVLRCFSPISPASCHVFAGVGFASSNGRFTVHIPAPK